MPADKTTEAILEILEEEAMLEEIHDALIEADLL